MGDVAEIDRKREQKRAQGKRYYEKHKDNINKKNRNRYKNDKVYREKKLEQLNAKRNQKIEYARNLKLGYGCCLCGYDRCGDSLEFHHVNPEDKGREISQLLRGSWNIYYLKMELAKCVILCSNCHREYHAGLIAYKVIENLWLKQSI